MVRLEFAITLRYKIGGPSDFIFNVHAAETAAQRIVAERIASNVPIAPMIGLDPHFGNRLMRLKMGAGDLSIHYQATVDIEHFLAESASIGEVPVDQIPPNVLPFLLPSRYCQSDRLVAMACREFAHLPKGYARVEAISRWVRQRIRFATGTTTSATTALDTLTDQRGVCRDFAHLMIALCRALNVPARFVTGVDYGADPALGPTDFHAYVEAYLGDRWYLFDPTDISPTTGLLRIGTGRDAADVSFATLFGDVRCEMPEVSILSIIDPARGLVAPARTRLAVSTTEAVAQRPTLQLIRRA
jgi:transglutaminase-like putative cysteine protease